VCGVASNRIAFWSPDQKALLDAAELVRALRQFGRDLGEFLTSMRAEAFEREP
jgi:hypothetical protein